MQQTQRTGNQERSERREAAQATSKRARRQAARRARLHTAWRAKAQPLPRPTERHPHRARTFSHARRADKSEGARRARVRARWWVVAKWVVYLLIVTHSPAGSSKPEPPPPRKGRTKGGRGCTPRAHQPPRTADETYIKAMGVRNANCDYVHRRGNRGALAPYLT